MTPLRQWDLKDGKLVGFDVELAEAVSKIGKKEKLSFKTLTGFKETELESGILI